MTIQIIVKYKDLVTKTTYIKVLKKRKNKVFCEVSNYMIDRSEFHQYRAKAICKNLEFERFNQNKLWFKIARDTSLTRSEKKRVLLYNNHALFIKFLNKYLDKIIDRYIDFAI